MEDQTQDTSVNESEKTTTAGQVMDIQPAKSITVTEDPTQTSTSDETPAEETPAEEVQTETPGNVVAPSEPTESEPMPDEASAETPALEPAPESSDEPTPEKTEGATSEPSATAINVTHDDSSEESAVTATPSDGPADDTQPSTPEAPVNPLAIPQDHKPHKSKPILAILLAIVVAVVLAGVVIFMYMRSKNGTTADTSKTSSSQAVVVEKPQASVSDVDTTTKDLETNLNKVDENKDFPATDLSDASLGL